MKHSEQVIVAGSGIAAAATARAIAAEGISVTLIDEREAVSGGGTEPEWYSSWWPGGDEQVARFAALGIDRLEAAYGESQGAFMMGRTGQLFAAVRPDIAGALRLGAGRSAALEAGPLREHATADWYLPSPRDGFRGVPDGFDVLEGTALRSIFPFLSPAVRIGVHVRRAGLVDARGLRRWLLARFRAAEGTVLVESVTAIESDGDQRWAVSLASGQVVRGRALVVVGPRSRILARRAGFEFLSLDATRVTGRLATPEGLLPAGAPMVVSADETPSLGDHHRQTELPSALGLAVPSIRAADGALLIETVAPPGTRPDQLMEITERTVKHLAGLVPELATRRGPPGSIVIGGTPLSATTDLRPIVGLVDRRGGYLLAGLGTGATFVMAGAEILAAQLASRAQPRFAPAFAPGRVVDSTP